MKGLLFQLYGDGGFIYNRVRILHSEETMYDSYPVYLKEDLGFTYSREKTRFRLWAPTATAVRIHFYKSGNGGNAILTCNMNPDADGTWTYVKWGDCNGLYYTYQVCVVEKWLPETTDPYGRTCGVNGKRSMVLDLKTTDPEGFSEDRGPLLEDPVDAIITEISVADMTIDKSCRSDYPGLYLGLAQEGLVTGMNLSTGLDHIRELGVTHVQLMPIFDFATVDESDPQRKAHNWGYDPLNYNVPEGSYATDPFHGEVRVRECKQMIQAFHSAGIGVIMDVVYNHVYQVDGSNFQRTVPDYYFRKNDKGFSNGSGCGNEIASERPMVRKYIVDSLCYWAREYHIDGFRFDLMGLIDSETMNEAAKALKAINPSIILYGEGWTGGESTLPETERSLKTQIDQMPEVGAFSDDIRDHVKGNVFDGKGCGFVNGAKGKENDISFCAAGAVEHPQVDYKAYTYSGGKAWGGRPGKVINYVSCHDNYTLWDKLTISAPKAGRKERMAMNRLSAAIVFTSQGVPFFLSGEEIGRSKPIQGTTFYSGNSYNLPPFTNSIKYDLKYDNYELFCFYKELIAFRKAHPALRLRTREEICDSLVFLEDMPENVVAFWLQTKEETLLVVYNANKSAVVIDDDTRSRWGVCIHNAKASRNMLYEADGEITIEGLSCLVAIRL